MAEIAYAVVKASARKGQLLSEQQIFDLASSKDLKDLVNKLKERYPNLLTSVGALNFEIIEEIMLEIFCDEVQEFIEMFPRAERVLGLIKQEVKEGQAAQELIEALKEGKKKEHEEIVAKLKQMGFEEEVKEGERVFEKYGVPGLIASVFTRCRILKLLKFLKMYNKQELEVLTEYVGIKVDEFNLATLIRGIKNDIRRDALEELFIFDGGSLKERLLKEAVRAPDLKKALSVLGYGAYQEDPRSLERNLEREIGRKLTKAYYRGYTNLAAVIGYLELKKLEIMNIVRIANCISRSIEPKKIVAEFIL